MSKDCENRYKTSRNSAGFTQEHAAALLGVALRTLSDYESGRVKVPDDIVAAMAELYKTPLIAWWHLKETSILGKYLPDVIMPQTDTDTIFQLIMAQDEIGPVIERLKKLISNGRFDKNKREEFKQSVEMGKGFISRAVSFTVYGDKLLNDWEKEEQA